MDETRPAVPAVKNSLLQQFSLGIILICCLLSIGFGFAALLGKQLHYAPVAQIETTRITMVYDTALSLCVASIGLLAILLRKNYLTFIAALFLFVMGVLSIFQHIFQVEWHITRDIILPFLQLRPEVSGKMLPITAVCFLLTAAALLHIAQKANRPKATLAFASAQGIILVSLGILFLFGYVVHVDQKHHIPQTFHFWEPMATNDSLGFIFLGMGIIFTVLYLSQKRSYDFNKSFPLLIAALISVISLLSWRYLITKTPLQQWIASLDWFTTARELFIALLVGTAIYFYQAARLYGKSSRRLLAMTRATFEATADGIVVTNNKGAIVDYNQKFLQMWQLDPQQQRRKLPELMLAAMMKQCKNSEQMRNKLSEIRKNPNQFSLGEVELKNNRSYEIHSQPQYIEERIIGHVYTFHDITHLKQAKDQLLFQATHDVLTGLANRLLLFDRIEQAILHAKRHQTLFAVLFLDLNRFKLVNDSLGHASGDKLLQATAERIKKYIRDEDTLARLGGDEFVVLAVGLNDTFDTVEITKKCLHAFDEPFYIDDHELFINASIGISIYPQDGDDAQTLLKNADIAMYIAKNGEENVRFYKATMYEHLTKRLLLENELPHIIAKNQLSIYYQPIIDIKSQRICATEALARWEHPIHGLLTPNTFVPIAEDTGFITTIGAWILQHACTQNKAWHDKNLLTTPISINVSVKQLEQPNFITELTRMMTEMQIDPSYCELELTESRLVHNIAHTRKMLEQLKQMGIKITVDDFGVGFTGLSYLKYFPLDKLKIDRSLIQNIASSQVEMAIVQGIITMCKNLGIRVVAEGVETPDQFEFLQRSGCDEIQGFYFSPPLSAADYEEFVRSWRA